MTNREWVDAHFAWSDRLGMPVPQLQLPWEHLGPEQQAAILEHWESSRGSIPTLVLRLEDEIRLKLAALYEEEDFAEACQLNADIAELASRINDLHIWYRTEQELEQETKRHS